MRFDLMPAEAISELSSAAAKVRWYGDFAPSACPHCGSLLTHSNGVKNRKPRIYCRSCKRTAYAGDR